MNEKIPKRSAAFLLAAPSFNLFYPFALAQRKEKEREKAFLRAFFLSFSLTRRAAREKKRKG